jgi:sulfur transfer complex TusBCD TusB component (DsrH family)
MGEEFYAVIKLVSGEEVLSLVAIDENDGDPILLLQNPVVMKMIHNQNGSVIKVKPWMEIPDDDIYAIKLDKAITITETKNEKIIHIYKKYISNTEDTIDYIEESGKVKVSSEMGYIDSVDQARKKLEKLFKGFKES